MGAIIALGHHEKYDGSGYPNGLHGEDIPLVARIVAAADVFDALVSVRPYKRAWSIDEGLEFTKSQRGKHFDPTVIDAFLSDRSAIETVLREFGD
jgi:two-component system response regulator RpfG